MDQLLARLPKTIIALAVLAAALVFFVMSDPPKTDCDAQLDLFHVAQKIFIYPSKKSSIDKPPQVQEFYQRCEAGNGPGACSDLFESLKKLNSDLSQLPNHCGPAVAEDRDLKGWTFKSLRLMVMLAWGDHSPAEYSLRYNWLGPADLAVFCRLTISTERLYGTEAYSEWREGVMKELPDHEKMSRERIWQYSLFSTPCHGL